MPFLLVATALWVVCHIGVYLSSSFFLPRDNYEVSLPLFRYLIEYAQAFRAVPSWVFGVDGGSWFEPLANNYLVFLPHRFIGLVLGLLGLQSNVAYKSALVIGIIFFCWGVYRLALEIKFSMREALAIAILAFCSSLGMGPLHQEQALATVFFTPFIFICLLRARTDSRWWILAAALLGWSCNIHYPHITLLFWLGVGVAALGQWFISRKGSLSRSGNSSVPHVSCAVALMVFVLTVLPVGYSYLTFRSQLSAPDRGARTVESKTTVDQEKINVMASTSLYPRHLAFYLGFTPLNDSKIGDLDENNLFAGVGVLLALLCLILFPVAGKSFWFVLLGWLALLSIGIYSPLASALYHIPGMGMFRQWYHFTSLLNLSLLFMSATVLKAFVGLALNRKESVLAMVAAALVCLLGLWCGGNVYIWGATTLLLLLKITHGFGSSERAGANSKVIFLWCLVGGLVWSHTAVEKVRKYTRWDQVVISSLSQAPLPFPYVGRFGQWKRLVSPLGLDGRSAMELNRAGLFYWLTENGSLSVVLPAEIEVAQGWGGLNLKIRQLPRLGIQRILVGQAWDSGWRWTNESGKDLAVEAGPFGLLSVPLTGKSFQLRHHYSLWYLLVGLMFGAVGFACWYVRYFELGRRESSAQTASSFPVISVRG